MSRTRARRPKSTRASANGPAAGSGGKGGASASRLPGLGPAVGNRTLGRLLGSAPTLELAGGADVPAPFLTRIAGGLALTVFFAQSRFLLDAENLAALQALADELPMLIEPSVRVDGHASGEGSAEDNLTLSERRRDLVVALLAADLEPRPDFSGSAHGETDLATPETGSGDELEASRARNRRVEIVVLHKVPEPDPEPDPEPIDLFPPIKIEPETPEERLERMIKNPPPPVEREKRTLKDLTDKALNDLIDGALDGVGIKKSKLRDEVRDRLRGAILSGAGEALDSALDATDLDDEAKEAIKETIRAGSRQPF